MDSNIKKQILELYNSGLSTVKIANAFDCTPGSVYSVLKSMECKLRSNKINSRKYTLNDSYFSKKIRVKKHTGLGLLLLTDT